VRLTGTELRLLATTAAVAWYRFQRDQTASPNIRQLAAEAQNRLLVGGCSPVATALSMP
jgi:hypothetical protein